MTWPDFDLSRLPSQFRMECAGFTARLQGWLSIAHNVDGTPIGATWQNVSYNALNFIADTGAWTVRGQDMAVNRYRLDNKTMQWAIEVNTSNVSTAGAFLRAVVPGGYVVAQQFTSQFTRTSDAGAAATMGLAIPIAGKNYVEFRSTVIGAGYGVTAGNNTSIQALITLEVQ